MRRRGRIALALLAAPALAGREAGDAGSPWTAAETAQILALSPVPPMARDETNRLSGDAAAISLGKRLFFSTGLSRSGGVSCAACHDPAAGFAGATALRPRDDGAMQGRHAPSLLGVGRNRWFLWDGRRDTLWAQALDAIETDMGGDPARMQRLMDADPHMRRDLARFRARLRESGDAEATFVLAGKALAAFVETLDNLPAPFDRYVVALKAGRAPKRSGPLEAGLRLFLGKGNCGACHGGPRFTDDEFHNVRLPVDPVAPEDSGRFIGLYLLRTARYGAGGRHSDAPHGERARLSAMQAQSRDRWGQFKTPSLRGVGSRRFFMHDGRFTTLESVIDHYSETPGATSLLEHETTPPPPVAFTPEEKAALLVFLQSL